MKRESIYGLITECYIITKLLLSKTKKLSFQKNTKIIDETTKSYMTSQDTDFHGKMLLFLFSTK